MNRRPRGRRAIALIRVSMTRGRGDELLSPDLQRSAISDYAQTRGFDVVQWVEALDESGSSRRSPWWKRLDQAVESIEAGDADAILVWKFSRAARWRKAWAVMLDRVEVAGGVLESATEQLDTTTSTGRLGRGILAELAAWESEVKGEQWREVISNRLGRGLPGNGRPRFGYTYDRATGYTPDPDLAGVVRALYERFVQGDTHVTLARWLAAEGVPTTRGGAWTPINLARWMDSGFPAGQLTTKDGVFPGAHEVIVPPALWANYQRVRESTRRQSPWVRQPPHPLGGLIRCGLCGAPACRITLRRYPKGGGPPTKRYRYRCCQQSSIGTGACAGPGMEQHLALSAVRDWLEGVAGEVDARAEALAGQRAAGTDARRTAKRLAREVERLDEGMARLAVQAALLPDAAYAMARDDLLRQRAEAAARLNAAQDRVEAMASPAPRVARSLLGSWDELVEADPKGLRDVLAALIDRCEIHPAETAGGRSRLVVVPRWESSRPV